jgi:DNA-binding transcriptional LysR family regulator
MIDQLEALAALAEHGTMRSAATRLRISQSAVTKRLDALEAQLGARLRERAGRRVRLTETAERLLERARPLLAELRLAVVGERSVASGWLVVGVSESILASWGPRVLADARRRRPELRFRLNAHRSPVAVDLVRAGEYMLALVAGSELAPGELARETLFEEEMAIVPSGLGKLALRRGIDVPVLSIEPGSATERALRVPLARLARERGIRLVPDAGIQSYTAAVQLARAGFGHALVPRPLALALGVPQRSLVPLPAPGLHRPIQLVGRAATLARDPASSFAEELRAALRRAGLSAASGSARTRP